VDTFHDFDKESLLRKFKRDTYEAIEEKMSLNPILYSFQEVVNKYNIPHDLIEAFFHSMEMDLSKSEYTERQDFNEYIYGSAEVVGLMCLQVFCEGDQKQYETLKPYAQALGAAFQKINFLRDIQADYNGLNRTYFPGFDFENFNEETKAKIELDIDADFQKAYKGILNLPWKARFGVYLAYKYYYSLFKKIRNLHPSKVLSSRIRIPDYQKMWIVFQAGMSFKLKIES
jgi:phytoene/squalene synthetase